MNFAIIIQWIYYTIWEKIRKNRHHYTTILSFYNIKTLQEELAKKSNIPWIWRTIYRHKLPYMKKTRKKKQVCGAACFMAAEIKFSKNVSADFRHITSRAPGPGATIRSLCTGLMLSLWCLSVTRGTQLPQLIGVHIPLWNRGTHGQLVWSITHEVPPSGLHRLEEGVLPVLHHCL